MKLLGFLNVNVFRQEIVAVTEILTNALSRKVESHLFLETLAEYNFISS